MKDRYGRKIEYLRLSVTDACNLSCHYCMPEGKSGICSCGNNMSAQEIGEIVSAFARLGVKKLRITGGEPLVRSDISDIVRCVSAIEGIEDISMTSNATLLAPMAKELYDAGIHRINISLDTLDEEKYRSITRGGSLSSAIEGIKAAAAVGMKPIKLNTVLIGGFNDDEIERLVSLTENYELELRFIELMPIGNTELFGKQAYIPASVVLEKCPQLKPDANMAHSVARMYRLPGAKGRVGLISPLSNHFCGECNRLRLTADGCIKPCLHSAEEIPVRGLHGAELEKTIIMAAEHKPMQHVELSATARSESKRSMYRIGG